MKAQLLLDRALAKLSNPTANAMQQAFDMAWNEIAHHFANDADRAASIRLKLAGHIITVTSDGSTDVEHIKAMALQMLWILERRAA